MSTQTYQSPVIIVGAARSGTKMLRDLLARHPVLFGIDYELERVWCQGNMNKILRPMPEAWLTPEIQKRIIRYFNKLSKKKGGRILEKNTAHSLRMDFVRKVFPHAPIIHIFRNGLDASLSAFKRWQSPLDLRYIIGNRKFPVNELPFFIARQLKYYIYKMVSQKSHAKTWGPKFQGIEECLEKYSLIEVCGMQWAQSINGILSSSARLSRYQFIEVCYEQLVQDPQKELFKILKFLDLEIPAGYSEYIRSAVYSSSVNRYQKIHYNDVYSKLRPHIEPQMKALGYY